MKADNHRPIKLKDEIFTIGYKIFKIILEKEYRQQRTSEHS